MAQDIRKLVQEQSSRGPVLPKRHKARFEAKLDAAFLEEEVPTSKGKSEAFFWLKIAAMVVVCLGIGFFTYQQWNGEETTPLAETSAKTENTNSDAMAQITLGDISPDLKKIENYYLTGINMQLASLSMGDENKELIDGYMQRLGELDAEYSLLNTELNEVGPTEATITALIDNLKLRLELLFKLKSKLKELKNQNNEEFKPIET
ncbi:hypothetical protein [Altibacter sp.]|uniref:hypothetical protein n=1 Tax=Altibacter sp. TaxID=2024823 RepID=UPI000C9616DB|nr:hypothetical protein [Altibacter sp.]MAP54544.1 hypothetical protein [Altibacter sp.]